MTNDENADVLILSGDILVASDLSEFVVDGSGQLVLATTSVRARGERYYNFIKRCCDQFPQVVYVAGNHEHYHGDFAMTFKILRDTFKEFNNLHILNNEWKIINGILFFGGTLWTNMNNQDPITMVSIRDQMNDYTAIKNSNKMVSYKTYLPDPSNPGQDKIVFKERVGNLTPADTVEDHYRFRTNLDEALSGHPGLPTVVVGHHAPSKQSVHPRYADEFILNGAYSTDLDNFILERPQIKVWSHGHVHDLWSYKVGTTRVVCNPRGYQNFEDIADTFRLRYFDITEDDTVDVSDFETEK